MNQLVVVGRLTVEPTKFDESLFLFSISVPRPYKNDKGEYETDNIKCLMTNTMEENLTRYVNLGDIIGIKGHIEVKNDTNYVFAEKMTFLGKKEEEK